MAEKKSFEKFGHYIFLIGIVVAVIFGFVWPDQKSIAALLALIGLVVGLLNVTTKETTPFLLATIALILGAQSFKLIPFIGTFLQNILTYIMTLVAPAAVVVALIAIWNLANKR